MNFSQCHVLWLCRRIWALGLNIRPVISVYICACGSWLFFFIDYEGDRCERPNERNEKMNMNEVGKGTGKNNKTTHSGGQRKPNHTCHDILHNNKISDWFLASSVTCHSASFNLSGSSIYLCTDNRIRLQAPETFHPMYFATLWMCRPLPSKIDV